MLRTPAPLIRTLGGSMSAFSFTDILEPARGTPLRVLARVSVVSTEDGGRKGPFTKHYRPNHNFGDTENRAFYIGQIEVADGDWVYPGETRDLEITFLNVGDLINLLKVGRTWRIQEGQKHVASAEVLQMLS